jgi:hypothetical protein
MGSLMRWSLPILLVLILAAPAEASGPAKARLLSCQPALEQADRSATFEGDMRRHPGAVKLQMRFTLQARRSDRRGWVRVAAPGWDTWTTSDPGKLRYVYDKTIENLPAPGTYRSSIRFRWLDALGRTIASTRRVSPSCRQPDPRPDLELGQIAYADGAYSVPVRNDGRSLAGAFDVALSVDGAPQAPRTVTSLLAGERAVLSIEAPPCDGAGEGVRVSLDPDLAVDESDELDNVVVVPCGDVSQR